MLSPGDLLNLAEQLVRRIPLDAPYEEERNAALALLGEAWLRLGGAGRTVWALSNLTEPARQAQLRHAVCLWLGENPGDGAAREFGEDAVRQLASQLLDPFTSGNVLVTLASAQDPGSRLETLREAGGFFGSRGRSGLCAALGVQRISGCRSHG